MGRRRASPRACRNHGDPFVPRRPDGDRQRGRDARLGVRAEDGVPTERRWIGGQEVIIHYDDVPPSDITVLHGLPVTTALRTVIDIAPELPDDRLRGVESPDQTAREEPQMRMLGPRGNPQARNLLEVIQHLQKAEGLHFELSLRAAS